MAPAATTTCPGCGLELAAGAPPYDGYFHASPECCALFHAAIEAEFGDAVLFGRVHQLTVDAYAVQHAGGPHPDKSVDVHLVGLHLVLERGFAPPDVPRVLQGLVGRFGGDWPHVEPPVERGARTIADVAAAEGPAEHAEAVRAWAAEVWGAWREHHATVAGWAESVLGD